MKHGRTDYDERIQDSAGLIPEDEPVLLIRAQDANAPDMALRYAALCLKSGLEGWRRATKQAAAIIFWQEGHPERVKQPDAPPGGEYDALSLPPGHTNRELWEEVLTLSKMGGGSQVLLAGIEKIAEGVLNGPK